MSRRAPMTTPAKFGLQRGRMAPGGRIWAESPVRTRWTTEAGIESEEEPEPPIPPGFYWPMDDTSGSQYLEATGGPPMVGVGMPVAYAVAPIAPDSTAAAKFSNNMNRGPREVGTSAYPVLAPNADGWISADFWFAGMVATTAIYESGYGFAFGADSSSIENVWTTMNYTPAPVLVFAETSAGGAVYSTTSFSGTHHVQIGYKVGAAGRVVIRWDDATVYDWSGTVAWSAENRFRLMLGCLGAYETSQMVFDEVRVYAGPPT